MFHQQPNISSVRWPVVGISPRSRWSNRDDSSYLDKRTNDKETRRPFVHYLGTSRGDSSAAKLLLGQISSMIALAMFHSGFEPPKNETIVTASDWQLGGPAILVTSLFALTSFFLLFRVAISGRAPRRRRILARLWLIAYFIGISISAGWAPPTYN